MINAKEKIMAIDIHANARFLESVTAQTKSLILGAIAKNYGITEQEAFDEVTDKEAEHLLEYMTGSERTACSVVMQKHGFR